MAFPERTSIRVPKTAEIVAGHIRRRIVNHELRQGDALPPEAALIQEFDVSRPSLREAFRILESEGLISVQRGARGGARVLEPSVDACARYAGLVLQHRDTTLSDVLDARVILESPAARILAARRDHVASARALATCLAAGQVEEIAHFHEFNALVVELTGSQTLILVTTLLEHISYSATLHLRMPADDGDRLIKRATRSRHKLVELISSGSADKAEAHWRAHLTEAGRYLQGAGDSVLGLLN